MALTTACIVFGLAAVFTGLAWSDTLWYLHVGDRVLDGDVLYRDIVETNPPLIVWFHLPIVALARALGADPVTVWIACIAVVLLASAVLTARLLESWAALPWLAFALFVVGGRASYGEREHLILATLLPWAAGALRRLQGLPAPAWLGVPAAVAFALKPYFALMGPLVVGLQAVRLGRRAALRLPEHWVTAGTLAVYGLSITILTPHYAELVDQVIRLYGAYRPSTVQSMLLTVPMGVAAIGLAMALFTRRQPRTDLLMALVITCCAAVLAQGKGYEYHYYPVLAAAVLLFASVPTRQHRIAAGVIAASIVLLRLPEAVGARFRNELRDIPIVAALRATYTPASFEAIDPTGAMTPFRYAHYGPAPWYPRWPFLWPLLLPAGPRVDSVITDELERMAREPTELLLIRTPDTGTHWVSNLPFQPSLARRLESFPAYDSLLRRYEEEAPVGHYRVFRLRHERP